MISEIVSPKRSEADRWVSVPERGTPASLGVIAWIAERVGRPLARLLLFPITIYFLITAHDGASGVLRIPESGRAGVQSTGGTCCAIFIILPLRFWTAFICCAVNSTGSASQFTGKKCCSAKTKTARAASC